MRRAVCVSLPWLPWVALGATAILGALNIANVIPDQLDRYLVGAAVVYTVCMLGGRRMCTLRSEVTRDVAKEIAGAAEQAPVSEAMLRGYQLAAQHCGTHDQDENSNGKPEEVTTVPIPGLRLVHHPHLGGTTYGNGQRPSDSGPGRHSYLIRRRLHL